jgi:hypothetical protein
MSGSEYIKREEGNACAFEVTPAPSPKFMMMAGGASRRSPRSKQIQRQSNGDRIKRPHLCER